MLLVGGATIPVHASAQDDQDDADAQARRVFRIAQAHYDNGEFEEAAEGFDEAYRLSQRPQLLYNMYIAHRDAQNLPRAADALRRFLEEVPDAPDRDQLNSRLERMEEALASGSSATITPEDDEDRIDPNAMDGDSASGASPETTEGSEPDVASTGDEPTTAPADDGSGASLPVPAIIVGSAGVGLIVAGVITGALASSAQSELEEGCPTRVGCDPALEDTLNSGQTLAVVTDVLLFTGIAAVGAGVLMFFLMRDDGESEPAPVAVGCGPHGCSATVRMGF